MLNAYLHFLRHLFSNTIKIGGIEMSLEKQGMRILRSAYVIWSFIHVLLWVFSGNLLRGILYIKKGFYPIDWSWEWDEISSISSKKYTYFNLNHYDISEFLIYVIGPLIIYFAIKIYKKP
jgi:hypothetical protein